MVDVDDVNTRAERLEEHLKRLKTCESFRY